MVFRKNQGGVAKRSLGSTMCGDDAEDEDECVLSKLGDGKGRRRSLGYVAVSISIKVGFRVVDGGNVLRGKDAGECVCFCFERGGRRGGSVGFAELGD